ncbi:hypothetical protein ACJVQT_23145 [Enterobacter huaxiensis]|uniref:hypothetical protein n=1 Tax=Enterobacter huaxiensis TaxID=2494702 RepID=UPI002175F26D|nr:hypothetical protein [Enterobacter huaxiensis]MCS5452475.1 hypothetical protein [Enterobacter huaxiensis]
MKKVMMIAALVASLSGCAQFNSIDGGKVADCNGIYTGQTFGLNQGMRYPVHINRTRSDRFGREFVRVQSSLDIQFFGGWKPREFLTDITCAAPAKLGA